MDVMIQVSNTFLLLYLISHVLRIYEATAYISYRKSLQTRLCKETLMCKSTRGLKMCKITLLAMFTGPLTLTNYLIADRYLKEVTNSEHSGNMISEFH